VHILKTPIARHQNVAHHVSSKKQLSIKTADHVAVMKEVITMHERFLKVYLPVVPDGVLAYDKSKLALKYRNDKAMPSGFSHFYFH